MDHGGIGAGTGPEGRQELCPAGRVGAGGWQGQGAITLQWDRHAWHPGWAKA